MAMFSDRSVRIFLSSTFRDFGEERDLLVRRVFPSLRSKLRDRFVEIVDVDLRWGITVEQAERGEVLPICLAEIDRARPFFVGMLGERYGWVPPRDAYAPDLIERQPWLEAHRGGRSVTELEVLHGVLNDPRMAGRAFFYFRAPDYARAKGGDYVAASAEDKAHQTELKERIRRSGFPVLEDYPNPEAFAQRLERDLWSVLDEAFPADQVPDAFVREEQRHEAYAAPRRRLYLGGERYVPALNAELEGGSQRVLVEGRSGGGKSALLANWLERRRRAYPRELVHVHYTGASADAADPYELVRRLCGAIQRRCGSEEEIPSDPKKLMEALPTWLACASAHAAQADTHWLIVVDALNGITDLRDLRWFPEFLPERVRVVVSCLPGEVLEALAEKEAWSRLEVEPLTGAEREELLRAYLARYNKTLPDLMVARVMAHPLSSNPLFLRTLAEELRVFGVHEELEARLGECLACATVDDLFERVLERIERDCGARKVRNALTAIWASRAGLAEEEILGVAGLVPATWAPIRYALDEALLESGGRLTFAHDFLRIAVSDRYLGGNGTLTAESQTAEAKKLRRVAHRKLAKWFEMPATRAASPKDTMRPADARVSAELPYQWLKAREWKRLRACLARRDMFEAVLEHRGEQELLSYWLNIEANTKAKLEEDYEAAWRDWQLPKTQGATGDVANTLSDFLRDAGRLGSFTVELAKLALRIEAKVHGQDSPQVGSRLNDLANLLWSKGDYTGAKPLYRRALVISETALGPTHPDTGGRLNNLALLLQDQGDYTGAEPLYRRALAITEEGLGPDHLKTGERLNNLAGLLVQKGDYAAAEPLFRRSLAIAEKVLGPSHRGSSVPLGNLAILLTDQKDYAAAQPLFHRALAIAENALGPNHPETSMALTGLAGLFQQQGDYIAAEPLYRRALSIAKRTLGPAHPNTGRVMHNLALALHGQRNHTAAQPLYQDALAIAEKVLGRQHHETAQVINNLARLFNHLGQFNNLKIILSKNLKGKEYLKIAEICERLAAHFTDDENFLEAIFFQRSVVEIYRSAGREFSSKTALHMASLAAMFENSGDLCRAAQTYREALEIMDDSHEDYESISDSLKQIMIFLEKGTKQ